MFTTKFIDNSFVTAVDGTQYRRDAGRQGWELGDQIPNRGAGVCQQYHQVGLSTVHLTTLLGSTSCVQTLVVRHLEAWHPCKRFHQLLRRVLTLDDTHILESAGMDALILPLGRIS